MKVTVKIRRNLFSIKFEVLGENLFIYSPKPLTGNFINRLIRQNYRRILELQQLSYKVLENWQLFDGTRLRDMKSKSQLRKLKNKLKSYILSKLEEYSKLLNLEPKKIGFSSARLKYGSCSATGKIIFSYKLLCLTKEEVDYVILHELAHLKIKNHRKQFWDFLRQYLPEARNLDRELRKKSHKIDIAFSWLNQLAKN